MYLSGGASALLTPVFAATVQYQPFDQTKLSVSASRTVSASYFQNQVTENTGVSADLNQRLLGRLFLDLSGGYAKTKYIASISGPSTTTGRNDDVYSFNARLTCPLLQRATVSVFFGYSNNSSSQSGFTSGSGFGYTSTQVGFDIGYRY